MKRILIINTILFLSINLIAQEWQIEGTELKAQKINGNIILSFTDDRYSLTFTADTLFFLEEPGVIIVKSVDKFGMIDPWDLYWLQQPIFNYYRMIDSYNLLVGKDGKYGFVSYSEEFIYSRSTFYDTLYLLTPPGEPVYNDMQLYVAKNKKNYGVINLDGEYSYELLPLKYDEVLFLKSHSDGILYKIRKGKKWGAGDCEGLEVSPMYDDIKYMAGSCSNNYFTVEQNGKLSIHGYFKHALYPFIFDAIQYVPGNMSDGYLILKSEGKMDIIEFCNFEAPPFQGRYDRVWIEKKDGNTVIYMEKKEEKTSIIVE